MLRAFAGGKLFGESYGSGSPWVLALHGWGRDHRDFNGVLGPRGFPYPDAVDAVAIDLPGFGATPPPSSAWSTTDYAKCLEPLLEEMSEKILLVGHSFGGRIAVRLAARCPEHFRGLVISGAPLIRISKPTKPAFAYRTIKFLSSIGLLPERSLEAARMRYGSMDYRMANGLMRTVLVGILHESYEDDLEALSLPVDLVWGSDDREVPVSIAMALQGVLGSATLTICEGAGHLTPLEAPTCLREIIEKHRSTTSGDR
ncbi:MAG: alpha/beta hydrolase [Actinobacteria bacterium]|nr:alpha/beta hydrolase [Actinomycetota bacterium]MCL6095365.1 alpha/beta hydrolase [Actinomycetota bacterium]